MEGILKPFPTLAISGWRRCSIVPCPTTCRTVAGRPPTPWTVIIMDPVKCLGDRWASGRTVGRLSVVTAPVLRVCTYCVVIVVVTNEYNG